MKKVRDWSIQTVLGALTLAGVMGTALLALGFTMSSPADTLEIHIENFDTHVENFETYLDMDAAKQAGREQRTDMIEIQTRLTCLRTGVDTLRLLAMLPVCDSLGVPRS